MYALVARPGSGYSMHKGEPHGISSLKLACGRTVLRSGTRVFEDAPTPLPPGTHPCVKCDNQKDS